MNPTVRAVGNPIAFRRKVDLIAFICVPDRFAAPVHLLCASSKEGLDHPFPVFNLIPVPYDTHFPDRQVAS
jgi:hypothetical protein